MLNKIFIMGRLTRDPELRRTQNGTAVAGFALAVDRDFKNADGTKETDFIEVVAWRSSAEFVSKYFAKGRMAKFFKDSCLLNQEFIQDSKMSVSQYLQSADKDLTVVAFKRFTLRAE